MTEQEDKSLNILEQLTQDMKSSMKAGDTQRTGVVRLLRGALKNEEIKAGKTLTEDEALGVLMREAKQRRDSIEAYRSAGRMDLAAIEEAELVVIRGYLPEVMSESELTQVIDETIMQLGAQDVKQMGSVIGAVRARVGARADGAVISRLVRERLTGASQ
jgi:uncharacterized protein